MEVITGYRNIRKPFTSPVLALGNFDGVHLGHRKILLSIRDRSQELKGTSVVYTFHPHPLSVLTEGKQPLTITTIGEKLALIEECGIDVVICEPFTIDYAQISADQFAEEILHQTIGAKEIFVGDDYRFGSKRQGDIHYLRKLGGRLGFRVKTVEPVMSDGTIVKSSNIRQLIQMGDVATANRLLGREYHITGPVIRGKGRGAGLGFPTANIKPNKNLHPPEGVYAVWVHYQGQQFMGAMNIGTNPTFKEKQVSFEVYVMNFSKQIYDEHLRISFVDRVRPEKTFSSVDSLIAQMNSDVAEVRRILSEQNSSYSS
ncbi:MAG TPA: bifunctional riboflavin kinase/FAD synthetase [Thermodesulfobacteriota bacterium]|nr:bifunctional riboflavin kinase/FAD synthetase [Deltaproteobacteria bacterium]HNR12173.1 bifunctional riboflavin kinase/FAD synthetase [Thermodesulfobacteriota bacterium]HNU73088.1 bifunctional riboflavin kinase/FAD synthetase [Thermodesulfobacteriota bacterium]HOC38160.1 bifunctional riboflavin kinase/FAD synthetase [Thermodesulfobacteriota bacterium]HQO77393.1 bifunctional riboflavin kinase/FAD synthetase [Thermodesulfobacteriota bacterium]